MRVGEVITRNPAGHREYYKDPEATARMWEGGWLHTGDLGYLDADGYLYIVGRKKEMVIRGGMNVRTPTTSKPRSLAGPTRRWWRRRWSAFPTRCWARTSPPSSSSGPGRVGVDRGPPGALRR